MPLTPTTTIIPSTVGNNGFNFINLGPNEWGQTYPSIYQHGTDKYFVFFNNTNINAPISAQIYKISIFKNALGEQDAANRPETSNWDWQFENFQGNFAYGFDVAQVGSILYIFFYLPPGGDKTINPLLAVKTFNMSTDSWGATITSTLIPAPGTNIDDNAGNLWDGSSPAIVVSYNSVTNSIFIINSAKFGLLGTNGTNYARPAYAQFKLGSSTFDANWTQLGPGNTDLNSYSAWSCTIGSCDGTIHLAIEQQNSVPMTPVITQYYQAIYSDLTVSAMQNLAISHNRNGNGISPSRILNTGSELLVVYGTVPSGIIPGYNAINVARAPVPVGHVLPVWATQVIFPDPGDGSQFTTYVPFYVNGQIVVVCAKFHGGTTGLTCATWNGVSWVLNATPASTVTLALAADFSIPYRGAYITYDFTGTVDASPTLMPQQQLLYSLVSYSLPFCGFVNLTFNLHGATPSGPGALTAANPPSGPPGPIVNPTNCVNQV